MQRYFIELSYKGTNYKGWQVQNGVETVQLRIDEALSTVLRENIHVIGAGRTDTGVHASYFVAHFDSKQDNLDCTSTIFNLNGYLPKDIAIRNIQKVSSDAHSRFDATSRTYQYNISRTKNPFYNDYSFYVYGEIDIDKMNTAANTLIQYEDFSSFCKSKSDVKTKLCNIYQSYWENKGNLLIYHIKANRFLRNMVRSITGTLLMIGLDKLKPEDIHRIVEARDRKAAGFSAQAKGLFLTDIEYPPHIFSKSPEI
ncbi:MAG: tRNA pseudouridine(38-40) synthase TruA [Marinilabiliales bacterium]|nr:MAG: tRNA pseudouridine(38-40) synthase TruA [Marinilabiliales bacterium]